MHKIKLLQKYNLVPNGNYYEGDWGKGQMHGYGTLFLMSRECYIGEFKNNFPDGYCVIEYFHGDTYWGLQFQSGQGYFNTTYGYSYEGIV